MNESAKLRAYATYPPLIRACAPMRLMRLRTFTLTNRRLARFFCLALLFQF